MSETLRERSQAVRSALRAHGPLPGLTNWCTCGHRGETAYQRESHLVDVVLIVTAPFAPTPDEPGQVDSGKGRDPSAHAKGPLRDATPHSAPGSTQGGGASAPSGYKPPDPSAAAPTLDEPGQMEGQNRVGGEAVYRPTCARCNQRMVFRRATGLWWCYPCAESAPPPPTPPPTPGEMRHGAPTDEQRHRDALADTREAYTQFHGWVLNCSWCDEFEAVGKTKTEALRGMQRHYDSVLPEGAHIR